MKDSIEMNKKLQEELQRIEDNSSNYYTYYDINKKEIIRITKEEAIERVLQKYNQEEKEERHNKRR